MSALTPAGRSWAEAHLDESIVASVALGGDDWPEGHRSLAIDSVNAKAIETGTKVGCAWFARCMNEAVTTVPHPVLGDVPCCQRCADFATQ